MKGNTMFKQNKILHVSALILSLLLPIHPAVAADEGLCRPFKDADVDHTLIETMLKSAIDGTLYRIKPNSSRMGFCVESSLGVVKGDFQKFNGGLTLEGNDSQSMVKINVASLDTNIPFIEQLLKSESFLYVDKHPDLVFVSTSFEWIDDKKAILKGKLKMRGVTKPVAFYVDITEVDGDLGDSDTIVVKATTTVHRTEFGMTSLSNMVEEKINLCMSIEAERYIQPISQYDAGLGIKKS
jgi:polyisoprenoid-binding protein YceI